MYIMATRTIRDEMLGYSVNACCEVIPSVSRILSAALLVHVARSIFAHRDGVASGV